VIPPLAHRAGIPTKIGAFLAGTSPRSPGPERRWKSRLSRAHISPSRLRGKRRFASSKLETNTGAAVFAVSPRRSARRLSMARSAVTPLKNAPAGFLRARFLTSRHGRSRFDPIPPVSPQAPRSYRATRSALPRRLLRRATPDPAEPYRPVGGSILDADRGSFLNAD
jgi:hypothetical protein